MNKKFFTLMAAALLGGAAMPSEAFAESAAVQDSTKLSLEIGATEYKEYAKYKLQNGLKFILQGHTTSTAGKGTFFNVRDSAGLAIVAEGDTSKLFSAAPAFEVRNFDENAYTFNLYVNGKKLVKSYGGKTYDIFFAEKYGTASRTDSTNFEIIKVALKGGESDLAFSDGVSGSGSYAKPWTRSNVQTAGSLNANEGGKSVKFSYPGAATAPADNKFGASLIAIKWGDVASNLGVVRTGTHAAEKNDSVMFVLNNDAGKALIKDGATADELKKATFVVINPASHLSIQALNVSNAEGQTLAYVTGDKLAAASTLKENALDKVNVWNAVYQVSQKDELNAAHDYDFRAGKVDVFAAGELQKNKSVKIGAYSAGEGSPYYVTTLAEDSEQKLVNAQVGGANFADTKALLKADGQAMYNIYLCGGGQGKEWYGKYLAATMWDRSESSISSPWTFGYDAYAPNEAANLKAADAVWIVTDAGERGKLKLVNARTLANELDLTLYATDDANVYEVASEIGGKEGGKKIKLIPAELDAYQTLSDDELKQNVEFVFNGVGVVTVKDVYMTHPGDSIFYADTNANKSFKWSIAKGDTITKRYNYAILKDNNVMSKADSISLQPYVLTSKDNTDGQTRYFAYFQRKVGGDKRIDTTWVKGVETQVLFKKTLDNTINILLVSAGNRDFDKNVAGNNMHLLAADLGQAVVDSVNFDELSLNHLIDVTVKTASTVSPSLPAVSRHATIIADGAGISMKENKDGLLEGIISDEPLTFWLDTADSEKETPLFYFSKGIATTETKADDAEAVKMRNFLYNPKDSVSYWDADNAEVVPDNRYKLAGTSYVKAIFRPAALVAEDTLLTIKKGEPVYVAAAAKADVCEGGLGRFQFKVTEAGDEGYYVINNDGTYLFNLNGKLGFTSTKADALVITLGEGDATANEAIEAETGVQVIGGQGVVTVQGAAGKVITVANILGQTIANQVAASDNVTITAPAGVVVVAVDGDATKVVVK